MGTAANCTDYWSCHVPQPVLANCSGDASRPSISKVTEPCFLGGMQGWAGGMGWIAFCRITWDWTGCKRPPPKLHLLQRMERKCSASEWLLAEVWSLALFH